LSHHSWISFIFVIHKQHLIKKINLWAALFFVYSQAALITIV
jgi:hypothetical protein